MDTTGIPAAAPADTRDALDAFTLYSWGLCYASVCTNLPDVEEITRRLNAALPTGVTPWAYTGEAFSGGQPNPCPCPVKPHTHRHYLFSC